MCVKMFASDLIHHLYFDFDNVFKKTNCISFHYTILFLQLSYTRFRNLFLKHFIILFNTLFEQPQTANVKQEFDRELS